MNNINNDKNNDQLTSLPPPPPPPPPNYHQIVTKTSKTLPFKRQQQQQQQKLQNKDTCSNSPSLLSPLAASSNISKNINENFQNNKRNWVKTKHTFNLFKQGNIRYSFTKSHSNKLSSNNDGHEERSLSGTSSGIIHSEPIQGSKQTLVARLASSKSDQIWKSFTINKNFKLKYRPSIPLEFITTEIKNGDAGNESESSSNNYTPQPIPLTTSSLTIIPEHFVLTQKQKSKTSSKSLSKSFGRLSNLMLGKSFESFGNKLQDQPQRPITLTKYRMKKLRGPYGESLESQLESSKQDLIKLKTLFEKQPTLISFTDELLSYTQETRDLLDQNSKEAIGTNTQSEDQVSEDQVALEDDKESDVEESRNKLMEPILFKARTRNVGIAKLRHSSSSKDHQRIIKDYDKTEEIKSIGSQSITAAIGHHLDIRAHIVGELYDTEKNYCESLKSLYKNYILPYVCNIGSSLSRELSSFSSSIPMSQSSSSDGLTCHKYIELISRVMPLVLEIHGKFLEQLRHRIAEWSEDQTEIGNIFDLFDNTEFISFYVCIIEHLNDMTMLLKTQQPKELEQQEQQLSMMTNNNQNQWNQTTIEKNKFILDNLLIAVIQRIPRYELLLKRLIKNTKEDHKDFKLLEQASEKVHDLLVKIGTYQLSNDAPQSHQILSDVAETSYGSKESSNELGTPIHEYGPTMPPKVVDHSTIVRQLYVKDLEMVIDNAQTVLDQYKPTALVHFYDNIMIRKRERTIFVLDNCIILCQIKNKKKSERFEYNKYKLQQVINIEHTDLRCQCWQQRNQGSNVSNSFQSNFGNGNNGGSGVESNPISACVTCIEKMELDIPIILKMQSRASILSTVPVRHSIETSLSDQLSIMVRQLAEMNEKLSRCSKDCSVDMFIISEDSSCTNRYDLMEENYEKTLMENKKIRMTHKKCPAHRKTVINGEPEYSISFSNYKRREEFETIVNSLRTEIAKSRFRLEYFCQIPFEQTRAGIQFTCALPAMNTNNIWICKSDGFIGQISILSVDSNLEKPTVVSTNSVCNAKILCLKVVPPSIISSSKNKQKHQTSGHSSNHYPNHHQTHAPKSLFQYSSDSSNTDETDNNEVDIKCSPMDDDKFVILKKNNNKHKKDDNKNIIKKNSLPYIRKHEISKSLLHTASPVTLKQESLEELEEEEEYENNHASDIDSDLLDINQQQQTKQQEVVLISPDCPTMWFGTDDYNIYIYSCLDAVRIGKNKTKIKLNCKVESIEYFKGRVFVGLANHTVAIFTRDINGYWQTKPRIIENIHCFRFCVVNQETMWTTTSNLIHIRDEELNVIKDPIIVKDIDKISFIVQNQSIFIASQHGSYVYRYSSTPPYELLTSIAIGPPVDKALKLCEQIIRYHKNACLKICSMHSVHDRVLVGTSAGVIVILDNKNTVEIVPNGHTSNVRFITSIFSQDGNLMIVSGGDGVEKFSPGTSSCNMMNSPSEVFHFMSYCSNLAMNLLGRSYSNTGSVESGSKEHVTTPFAISGTTPGTFSNTSPTTVLEDNETETIVSPTAALSSSLDQQYQQQAAIEPIQSDSLISLETQKNNMNMVSGMVDSKSYLLVWKVF